MAAVRACLLAFCMIGAALLALAARKICRPGGWIARQLGRFFCRVVLRLLRIEVVVTGTPPQGSDGVLLTANHVSWIDPLILFAVSPAAMLAKQEVGAWPIIGSLARFQATVLVDRSRRMRIPRVNAEMAERLSEGRNVLLFPEGTTYDGTRRGRFMTSHLACLAGVPGRRCAQPVALAYSDPAAAWIGDDTLLPHLWSVLRRPPITCSVAYGATLAVASTFDRKRLGSRLAADIEELLSQDVRRSNPLPQTASVERTGLIVTEA